MAPPPSPSLPLGERLKQLAQRLQFGWFVGHLALVLAVFRYLLSVLTFNSTSRMAQASYRFAFIAAAATYGIVVYKSHIARGDMKGNVPALVMKLAGDENVQYLLIALVWLYARQITIAVLPFAIYSFFHVATFTRSHLIPTIQPPKEPEPGAGSPSRQGAKQSPLWCSLGLRQVSRSLLCSDGGWNIRQILTDFFLLFTVSSLSLFCHCSSSASSSFIVLAPARNIVVAVSSALAGFVNAVILQSVWNCPAPSL
ncbi:endoplasmic reticulum protein [Coccidioides immitis H538.4]|uniref:Endoplasmic reticulum protein n=1 Tax=Coccidioides immitis H538.4 TaxID=396776 RepID=A0A0J8S591_COCIT|nr:endoplasmic reticulum protein [Coccidioides immitis H538.4]